MTTTTTMTIETLHAVDTVSTQTNTSPAPVKKDLRKRQWHTEESWNAIQEKRLSAFREKQAFKKRRLEEFDELLKKVEEQSNTISELNLKIMKLEETNAGN